MKKFIRFITAFFCVFMLSVFASQHVHAEETETVTPSALSDEGQAYAVLTDAGEFIFFRSNETYTDKSTGTFTDVKGNSYTGTVYSGIEAEADQYVSTPSWSENAGKIKSVRVAPDQRIAPYSMSLWFSSFENLQEIDLGGIDTSNCTQMFGLFMGCKSLKKLDLSNFNTANIDIFSSMFQHCESLEEVDLSSFDTSKATDMWSMFSWCKNLKKLDLHNFKTSAVTTFDSMFYECNSLEELDLSSFDTSAAESTARMFTGCYNLKKLDVRHFNTSKVTAMGGMFSGCNSLEELDVSGFDTSNVRFMEYMFGSCRNLKTLDVSNFDTSSCINLSGFIDCCENLKSIDVSGFNTSKVTDMTDMFRECKNLEEVDVSHFDTSNVIGTDFMFYQCPKLKNVDVSHFNTSNVKSFYHMFADCKAIESLDISSFDSSKVTDMRYMFDGDSSLTSVKLGPKFTVWSGDAYLPAGTWTNKVIGKSLTEKELYSQYPSNAAKYAGTWERTIVVPTSITLNKTSAELSVDEYLFLDETVMPENATDRSVTWFSSNSDVATVSGGTVKAKSKGTAIITATTHNGLTATCTVTVGSETKPVPTSISLVNTANSVTVGSYYAPVATVLPSNADQTVKWSVDNPDIASISAGGFLRGLKAGTVTVTAETVNGLKAQRTIRVLFTDVPAEEKYYSKAVYWAVENGITNGYKDSDGFARTFRPSNHCTREAVVTFLWRLAGKPNPKSMNSPFSDVKDTNKYYYKAVLWAVEKGITKGYADGTFKPDATCLREHVVTFLWRYAGKPAPKTSKNPFNDVYKSDYYYNAAIWANENGIAKGYSDGAYKGGFGPKLYCLREHVVTFLYRYAQKF